MFSNHVSQVIKSTRVQARDLYRIRPLLDLNTSVLLANALVSSRLDYCNSLFLLLTDFELRRLQLVQNQSNTGYNLKLVLLHIRFSTRVNQFTLGLIHPYTSSRNTRRSTPNSSSFKPPLLIVKFTNHLNTFLISSVTMPLSIGTLSLSM